MNHATDELEIWNDVDDVFVVSSFFSIFIIFKFQDLNEKQRRVSGHSISPNSSLSDEPATIPEPPQDPEMILNELPIRNKNSKYKFS